MAAAAILDFWNLKVLTVGTVKSVELRHRAKLRWNRPKRGRAIAIYRFFKMAAAANMYFWNFKFLTVEMLNRAKFLQKRYNRGRNMAILQFFKMAAAAILDFWNFNVLTVGTVNSVELYVTMPNFVEIARNAAEICKF